MKRYLLLALAVAAHAQSAGTVEGTVLNGANGQAIGGAMVLLEGVADSYAAQADARGHFQMPSVTPGTYTARVEREGYLPARRVAPHYEVTAGQKVEVELRMIALGAITGRVTDPEGDAVSHVTVEAMRYAYPRGKKELTTVAQATSDDRGEYRLGNLPPGRYSVRATLRFSSLDVGNTAMRIRGNKPTLTFSPTFLDSALEVGSARSVEVSAGVETNNANVQLRPDAYYTLRVTITGADSAPVMFSCMSTARPGIVGGFGGSMGNGKALQCPDHAPGIYVVEAGDRTGSLHARKTVHMLNGDADVTLQLAKAAGVSGVVRVEGGGVLPRAAMRVTLEADDDWDSIGVAVSDAGAFTVPLAQPMQYRLRVAIPKGGYVKSIYQGTRELSTPKVDLARSTAPLSIAVGTDGGTVEGVTTDGAAVVLVPAGARREWADLIRQATAGAGGRFELRDVAPGEYQLFAWEDVEPGAPLDADFRAPFASRATAVSVKAGERVVVTVAAFGQKGLAADPRR